MIAEKVEDSSSSVAVRHNQKYGRHLFATRDIKPGEIIFEEKPYVAFVNNAKFYLYCTHCLAVLWTGMPCDHCGWAFFCSQQCKDEAWQQYHDIECVCFPLIIFSSIEFDNGMLRAYGMGHKPIARNSLAMRALIKGVREAGGLKKFKAELQSIDKCTGE